MTKPCVLCRTPTNFTPGAGMNTMSLFLSTGSRKAYVVCRSCMSGKDDDVLVKQILAVPEPQRQDSWSHDN